MRITIDIRLLSRGSTTGIPGYTKDLVSALLSEHPENQYALFYNALRKRPLPEEWTKLSNVRVTGSRLPNRLLNLLYRTYNAPRIERYVSTDLIFSPHFDLIPQTATPRVITFHDLSFLHYPEFFTVRDRLWHRLQRYKIQAENAARIIAVSEFTKADLVRLLKLPEDKIDVVYPGVNPCFRPIEKDDARLISFKKSNNLLRPYILHLASLEPRKNIELLIRAFGELKRESFFADYELILAGRPGYGHEKLERLAETVPGGTDIRFFGIARDEDRPLLYAGARSFVFPSWFEGFGFPPLEAQACATPVLASDRTSLPETLGDSAMLFNPWNASELARSLYAIETDPKLRENILVRGTKNAARFSWSQAAAQTLETFKRAITS